MMGWQPQDSNLPAQAVFLCSGTRYTQQCTAEAVPATSKRRRFEVPKSGVGLGSGPVGVIVDARGVGEYRLGLPSLNDIAVEEDGYYLGIKRRLVR
jgi:hypothetical protein